MSEVTRPRQHRRIASHDIPLLGPVLRARRQHADQQPRSLQPPGLVVLYRQPTSSEDLLCAATIDHLDSLSLSESWFALLPRRVGYHATLDAATQAFINSNRFSLHCQDASVAVCLRSYVQAIEGQRLLTSTASGRVSDEALLSCALLGHFERTMGQSYGPEALQRVLQQTLMHLHAMQTMLLTRIDNLQANEFDFTLISGHYMLLLEAPIATGTPSPFERIALADPTSISKNKSLTPAAHLRRTAADLMLQAPRLIADTRAVRTFSVDKAELAEIRQRAQLLLDRKDEATESTILHNVKVTASTSGPASLTPYSFTFATLADFDAALNYWHARLLILRACWFFGISSSSNVDIAAEGRQAATNILMSWPARETASMFAKIRLLHVSCSLWGAILDFGVTLTRPVGKVREVLVGRINELYGPIVGGTTMEKLDEIAAVYAGGELKGPLVGMYRRFWPVKRGRTPKLRNQC